MLNENAFVRPPSGEQGNLGRNAVRGFGAWQVDFSVRRQFVLTEQLNLQFRAEFFNLFNHPNFGPPISNLVFQGSGIFGQVTQMLAPSLGEAAFFRGLNPLHQVGGPRSIQFALKLIF